MDLGSQQFIIRWLAQHQAKTAYVCELLQELSEWCLLILATGLTNLYGDTGKLFGDYWLPNVIDAVPSLVL